MPSCKDVRVFGIAAFYLMLVVYWSTGIRFNAAPDEYTHFFLVEYLLRFGSTPLQPSASAFDFIGITSGASYHTGVFWYYGMPNIHAFATAAIGYVIINWFGLMPSPLVVRSFNWLLSVPFLLALTSIARDSASLAGMPSRLRWTPLLLATLVALIPQVLFLFSYFNSDAFGLTVVTVALAMALRFIARRTVGWAVSSGMAVGVLLCCKIYFLPALGAMGVVAVAFWQEKGAWPSLSTFAYWVGAASLIAIPVLTATWLWYGEAFGMEGQQDFARFYGLDPKFMRGTCFFGCSTAIIEWTNLWWWLSLTFKSFFYDLGWVDVVLPVRFYQLFFLPICLGLIGASIMIVRDRSAVLMGWQPVAAIGFWMLLILLIGANLLGSQRLLPQPQGRYLYAILPFIPLLGGAALANPRAERIMRRVIPLISAVMLTVNIVGAQAMRAAPARPIEGSPGYNRV